MVSPQRKDLLKPLGSRPKTPGKKELRERNDRFISNRGATDIENAHLLERVDTGGSEFNTELAKQLSLGHQQKLLSFKSSKPKLPAISSQNEGLLPLGSSGPKSGGSRHARFIPQQPDRVLDAPDLTDDFYVNVLHWSAGNKLAVGLGSALYLWDGDTAEVSLFKETDPTAITAVRWDASGTHLAMGMADNTILLFNVEQNKHVRILRGHTGRVTALSWNGSTLSSGSAGEFIMNSDVRVKQHCTQQLQFHTKTVCGLQWNNDGDQLASGGGDNLVAIWDQRKPEQPQFALSEHKAAVKALAWCPWQRKVLASGGGHADRHVRIWDARQGQQLASFDTRSLVGAILWNPHDKEILTGLGYPNNQLSLWKYPSCQKSAEMVSHKERILHMAISPDGCTVCSGAGDETLRFWKVFDRPAPKRAALGDATTGGSVLKSVRIR